MIKTYIFALFVIAMGVIGCGKQDPFEECGEKCANAIPPEQKQDEDEQDGDSSNAMIIDASNYLQFREGQKAKYTVGGRVLIPGQKVKLEVLGMPKGMTYKALTTNAASVSGEIEWTPPKGYNGNVAFTETKVTFRLTTLLPTIRQTEQSTIVRVDREPGSPIVQSVQGIDVLKEGEVKKFTIRVQDPNSSDVPPRLEFEDVSSIIDIVTGPPGNASPYIGSEAVIVGGMNPSAKPPSYSGGVWTFYYQMNTFDNVAKTHMELTPNQDTYAFQVTAFSSAGAASAPFSKKFPVNNTGRNPLISWGNADWRATAGQTVNFDYQAFDAYNEGRITVDGVTMQLNQWPGVPTNTCAPVTPSNMSCRLSWTIPAGTTGNFELKLNVKNVAPSAGKEDGDTKTVTFTKRINIQ